MGFRKQHPAVLPVSFACLATIAVGDKNSLGVGAKKICPNMTNLVGKMHERQQASFS